MAARGAKEGLLVFYRKSFGTPNYRDVIVFEKHTETKTWRFQISPVNFEDHFQKAPFRV